MPSGSEPSSLGEARSEKEKARDYNASRAEALLHEIAPVDPLYGAMMAAAAAHASLAVLYQARIEWEHGVGY